MQRRGMSAAGLLLAAVAFSGLSMSETAWQSAPSPMQLFQKMLPAIRHPRCSNCHGVVDPSTGRNHKGGMISTDKADKKNYMSCMDAACHSDAKEWQLPGEEHFFAGRTDKEICSQVSDFVSTFGQAKFITEHAMKDDQILLAFEGFMGGASPDTVSHEPPITHAEFIAAARDWVMKGNAACEPEGVIRVEESVTSADRFTIGGAAHLITQTGTRTVIITSVGGTHRADIAVDGLIIHRSVQNSTTATGQPCQVILTTRTQYSGKTSGAALVSVKDTSFRIPALRPPQTDYRVDITLPAEKTRQTVVHSVQNGCGVILPTLDDDVQTFDWPGWEFTLEGYLEDSRSRVASGGCNKTITMDKVGETLSFIQVPCNRFGNMGNATEPWLVNHGAAGSYHDGSPIAFQTVSTWNLRRR